MLMTGFYSIDELKSLGLKKIGKNVFISRKSSIYGASRITIGDNVRIDDFSILSAGSVGIEIGNFIHIGAYSSLIGGGRISLDDYCNISSKVAIYGSNDDYSGEYMTNPMLPDEYTNVTIGDVILEKHVIIGSGSVVLPNTLLKIGACVGAMSLINKQCDSFTVYAGIPAKKIKKRSQTLLNHENMLRSVLDQKPL